MLDPLLLQFRPVSTLADLPQGFLRCLPIAHSTPMAARHATKATNASTIATTVGPAQNNPANTGGAKASTISSVRRR
jgi:hypothetical protein